MQNNEYIRPIIESVDETETKFDLFINVQQQKCVLLKMLLDKSSLFQINKQNDDHKPLKNIRFLNCGNNIIVFLLHFASIEQLTYSSR